MDKISKLLAPMIHPRISILKIVIGAARYPITKFHLKCLLPVIVISLIGSISRGEELALKSQFGIISLKKVLINHQLVDPNMLRLVQATQEVL